MKQFFTGIYNLWYFRKVIWNFRWWDYVHNIELLQKSFEYSAKHTRRHGCSENHEQTADEMELFVELLDKVRTANFINQAEKIVGYELKNWEIIDGKLIKSLSDARSKEREVLDMANKLETDNWNNIWQLAKMHMQTWWD